MLQVPRRAAALALLPLAFAPLVACSDDSDDPESSAPVAATATTTTTTTTTTGGDAGDTDDYPPRGRHRHRYH